MPERRIYTGSLDYAAVRSYVAPENGQSAVAGIGVAYRAYAARLAVEIEGLVIIVL